jgi:hypothetical protein
MSTRPLDPDEVLALALVLALVPGVALGVAVGVVVAVRVGVLLGVGVLFLWVLPFAFLRSPPAK